MPRDHCFCFCKLCISFKVCSVSFKEDVSGKWVMRLEKECRNSYPLPYLPVLNCKWKKEKSQPCLPTTLLWSNISYPGSRLGGGGTQHPFIFNGLGGGSHQGDLWFFKMLVELFQIVGVIEKVGLHGQVCQVFSVKQIETLHWPFSWSFCRA